jgi:3-phosphoshikimate 1-carboxyvinyltransferase
MLMTVLEIIPVSHALRAAVRVPGSKSLTNRALLIAALAAGRTRLTNALFSDDTLTFAQALQTLGFDVQLDPSHREMSVTGLDGVIPAKQAQIFCGNAGTAARFLSAFLTLGNGGFVLDGDARMRSRPISDLVSALTQLGARLEISSSNCPPVKIFGSGLPGGQTSIAGDISSQFLSGLLMVAPYAKAPVDIRVTTELNSRPYIDMTLGVMCDFGVEIEREGYRRFMIHPGRYHSEATYTIESDASAASYFFAAAAICTGTIRVENISRRSKQGDMAFLDVLQQMGCIVSEGEGYIEVSGSAALCGVDVDLRDIPDTAQTLASIAPFAITPTHIRGVATSRLKESDRIAATCTELARLGVHVEEHPDGMTIHPCQSFEPAIIQTYNDHRMAMAFSLTGLRVPGLKIDNPACVSKTFPDYFDVLRTLG